MILAKNKQNYYVISTKKLRITSKLPYKIDQKNGSYFKKALKEGLQVISKYTIISTKITSNLPNYINKMELS